MKKLALAATVPLAVAAALFVLVVGTLPHRRLPLASFDDGTVPGILHVHTNRSDGLSSPDEVAAAAARAGLKFVVFTDHGDGTRTPDPPAYRSGVLCLDGVEISTNGGHYVAIGMPASPYPLGGDAPGVVEDVRRLGGFGIVAHPDSPKPQLQWRDWDLPFDGIELLNPDTSWRVLAAEAGWGSKRKLLTAFIDYPFRSPEVIASLIQPTGALDRWESAATRRRVVVIAGADAHARLALRSADPADARFALPVPGYETAFQVMSVHVSLGRALSGDAGRDSRALLEAIRDGRLYTAIDGLASPPSFEFSATNAKGTAQEGDELSPGGAVQLRVQSNAPPEFQIVVHENQKVITSVRDAPDLIVHASERPAVYWVEIVDSSRVPALTWIRSNAIYVGEPEADRGRTPSDRPKAAQAVFDGRSTRGWSVEHDSMSVGAVDVASTGDASSGGELRFRYGLAGGAVAGQVTALVLDTPSGVGSYDRLTFTGRAERPSRVSVQLRDQAARRWQRSVYLDTMPREVTLPFADFTTVAPVTGRPSPPDLRTILFVVDTTNSKPGASGRIWIGRAALEQSVTSGP